MTLSQVFTVLAVFGGFGFMIWSKLVQRNHPIVQKVRDLISKSKEKTKEVVDIDSKWQPPVLERKIM